jgi:hypothetical protein
VRNGRQPGTQLHELPVDKNSAWAAVTGEPKRGKMKSSSVEAVARNG